MTARCRHLHARDKTLASWGPSTHDGEASRRLAPNPPHWASYSLSISCIRSVREDRSFRKLVSQDRTRRHIRPKQLTRVNIKCRQLAIWHGHYNSRVAKKN
jgi:hypothetical protein